MQVLQEQRSRSSRRAALPPDSLALLVGAIRRRLKQVAWRRLAPFRLTPPQLGFLLALFDSEEPLSSTELARRLYSDDPTASRVVRRLVTRQLLRQAPDPDDRRRCRLALTARGEALAAELAEISRGLQTELEQGFSEAELAGLRKGLCQLMANLDRMEADRPPKKSPRPRRTP